jgi:hypothetical protein
VLVASRESFVFETVFSDPVGEKIEFLCGITRLTKFARALPARPPIRYSLRPLSLIRHARQHASPLLTQLHGCVKRIRSKPSANGVHFGYCR